MLAIVFLAPTGRRAPGNCKQCSLKLEYIPALEKGCSDKIKPALGGGRYSPERSSTCRAEGLLFGCAARCIREDVLCYLALCGRNLSALGREFSNLVKQS
jgi:hypothetical protein